MEHGRTDGRCGPGGENLMFSRGRLVVSCTPTLPTFHTLL